jgi:signal transduction histidine kinase
MRFDQFKSIYRSLRFRLTLWNTAVVLLTAVAALIALREGLRVTLLRETDQRLLEDAEELKLAIEEMYPNLAQIREELDRKAEGHKAHGMFVRLLGPGDETVWATAMPVENNLPEIWPTDEALLMTAGKYRLARQHVRVSDGKEFRIRIGTSLDFIENDVERLTRIIVLVGGIILMLSPIGGYWLAGRATRPLAEMHRTAAALRPDRLEERLRIRGTDDELDRLSATINGLLDRIAEYIARHREFLANAAHELRSPLAAVQSSVEVALNVGRSPREYEELLGEIVEECSALRVLVNQLLTLAEVEIGSSQLTEETVQLHQVVARSADMFRGVAEERNIELRVGRLDKAEVLANSVRLRQVVNNLLDNAVKFNQAGGWVAVDVISDKETQSAVLRIADSGPGIAESEIPHIFERFYRGDKARQRDTPLHGSGLGLSICQAIVTLYGGTIAVENAPGQGAVFVVKLPLKMHPAELDLPRHYSTAGQPC